MGYPTLTASTGMVQGQSQPVQIWPPVPCANYHSMDITVLTRVCSDCPANEGMADQ